MNKVKQSINDGMKAIYKEAILELYRHPLHKTVIDQPDVEHRGMNPQCGDDITLQIRFDSNGKVTAVGHQGQGCAISQAAVSLLTEDILGKTKQELQDMTKENMLNLLAIPISHTRLKCALLGWKTLQEAIKK